MHDAIPPPAADHSLDDTRPGHLLHAARTHRSAREVASDCGSERVEQARELGRIEGRQDALVFQLRQAYEADGMARNLALQDARDQHRERMSWLRVFAVVQVAGLVAVWCILGWIVARSYHLPGVGS